MNQSRRKKIQKMLATVSDIEDKCSVLSSLVEDVLEKESSCLNNIPESLEGTDRWQAISDAVDNLESARDSISDMIDNISSAYDCLQNASA